MNGGRRLNKILREDRRRLLGNQERIDSLLSKRLKCRVTITLDEERVLHLSGGVWRSVRPLDGEDGRLWEYESKTGRLVRTR